MSVWISLRGILRLIRIDTLRRVHNVGFLTKQLKYFRIKTRTAGMVPHPNPIITLPGTTVMLQEKYNLREFKTLAKII